MAKIVGTILVFVIAVLETSAAAAGFRSPESLVRNVYAHYGDGSSDLSNGLPHDLPRRASSLIRVCGPHGFR
jgi:hypothetical protein